MNNFDSVCIITISYIRRTKVYKITEKGGIKINSTIKSLCAPIQHESMQITAVVICCLQVNTDLSICDWVGVLCSFFKDYLGINLIISTELYTFHV